MLEHVPARIGELAHTFSHKIQYAGARMLFMPVNKNGATCRNLPTFVFARISSVAFLFNEKKRKLREKKDARR
jgi:hypothetical protein